MNLNSTGSKNQQKNIWIDGLYLHRVGVTLEVTPAALPRWKYEHIPVSAYVNVFPLSASEAAMAVEKVTVDPEALFSSTLPE